MRDMRDNPLLRTFALAAQLGFTIACPMVAFIAGGAWLDGRLGTTPWLLFLGVALGILAAGGALYRLSMAPGRMRTTRSTGAPYKVERTSAKLGTTRADKRRRNGGPK